MKEELIEIRERVKRIEEKIDGFIDCSSANKADIGWLKGITKINFTMLATFILGMLSWLIKTVIGK